jgi:signal transduction histidine kinase
MWRLVLAALEHKITRELVEGCEQSCPAIGCFGDEHDRIAEALHIDAITRDTILLRKPYGLGCVTPNIDTVLLCVHDRGIGIPHGELKRIFNRFYRATNPVAGQVKGTGLGLFIVRSLARRHGGDVYAESEGQGRGSTFTVRLPRIYRV